ncbi:23113_t:CDS:2 [Entrophospora sp. SA101]|nr:23113_t:CDS:2 [Entrophospora sp. SA101]
MSSFTNRDGFNNEFNNNEFNNKEFNNNEFNNNEFNNNEFNNNEFNDNEFNDNEFNNEQDFYKCFVDLVSELDSCYRLPCHQTISSWIESIFKKQKIVIKKMFNDFSHRVSLTTDAWTSTTTNQGYLGITAHWIDDSWRMKKILLNFIPLNESHTGVYLANKILDTLEEFSLCKKVLAMTTDNGSNMVSLAEHLNNYLIQFKNTTIRILCISDVVLMC